MLWIFSDHFSSDFLPGHISKWVRIKHTKRCRKPDWDPQALLGQLRLKMEWFVPFHATKPEYSLSIEIFISENVPIVMFNFCTDQYAHIFMLGKFIDSWYKLTLIV